MADVAAEEEVAEERADRVPATWWAAGEAADGTELFPKWWLFFLPLYWWPQGINWGLIQTYLIPFQVIAIVGDQHKHLALSMMIVCQNIGSFFGPIWGALSDALWSRKTGRYMRRPMIVIGQLLFVGACIVMATATSFPVFLLSYALFTGTATISGAPYVSINTMVPTQQRGLYNAFWNWQSTFMGFTVNGLGALVGERKLSDSSAYILSIIVVLFPTLPIGMVGLSEAAPDIRKCPLGWWLPEVKRVEPEPTGADLRQKAKLGSRCTPSGAQLCLGDFVSAFAYPPFRWLFITTVMNTVYATFANLFNIYWFQDIVGAHGFSLFGHHITDSPRSALALTATINSIISLVVTLPAGLMFYSSLITTLCPLVNAYLPTYTWTVCCNLFSGVTAGFTGVCSRSLQADCVPFDPVTKRPREPARDFMVMQYASVIPSLIIPALLGIAFGLFPSRAEGYKVFFLISAAIHFVSSVLYLKVQWTQNTARAQAKRFLDRLTSGEVQESDNEADLAVVAKQRRAPLGARFCDRLLFGEELRRWLEESVRMPRSGGGDNANARGLLATRKGGHAA